MARTTLHLLACRVFAEEGAEQRPHHLLGVINACLISVAELDAIIGWRPPGRSATVLA
jgi:hypothetical protein